MKARRRWKRCALLAVAAAACAFVVAQGADPTRDAADKHRVPVDVARERAQTLHGVYSATLDVMHDRYFHDERAMVPARALEDVFGQLTKETGVKARWISVNTRPMSINHEPKSEFEKKAAAEISAGKTELELVEDGYLHRAVAISLHSGCVSCHSGFLSAPPKTPRFAALVISVPVQETKK